MAIQIGDTLPHFTATQQDGSSFDSHVVHNKPVVIYFYPKDFTPGCTTQACSFRDAYQDFQDLGAEVIGVSGDSANSHQNFQKKYKLPFILLSDDERKLRQLFGVPTALFGLLPGRVTYVFNASGKCIYIFDNLSAKNHITKALAALKKSI
ncbi:MULTISPECIES: peroxiredoxin [unclassified Flavobacterium]|uniref:peroxiredoxin n=1 Tax=unclassified Flavobacterium TaxID=196869 RepID=UPI0012909079|nr:MULTISPECIES: peroxiredoxin [unclassified Flavobacterium]MQP51980.1 redoxin domain-containing protein [Flavobacterium sp. LMO9]MQP61849.1 redoxin domain-containing protein [Flavobacterium sp. LMO6]